MQVCQLFVKSQAGAPVRSQSRLQLVAGRGIQGDVHAQPGSPRQVLILERPTLEQFGLQPGDLRENILLDEGLQGWASGHGLQIGSSLIRLTFRCEPCRYLESLQSGLTHRLKQQRGWLGMVITGGAIAIEDPVLLTDQRFPSLSDIPKERFYQFVASIPLGKVVTTKDVILAVGVTSSYYRTLPGWLKRAPATIPVHRIVTRDRTLFSAHLPHQAEALFREGVEILAGEVSRPYCWQPEHFHPSFSS